MQSLKYSSYSYLSICITLLLFAFDSSWIDIYTKHKISMIRIRMLQYLVESCVCAVFSFFFFFVNVATTNTVNVDEWFESFINFVCVFLNLWIWMSRPMNQTYFECYGFDVNVVIILIAICTYKSISWISLPLAHLYSKLHEYLGVAKNWFIADLFINLIGLVSVRVNFRIFSIFFFTMTCWSNLVFLLFFAIFFKGPPSNCNAIVITICWN